MSASQDNAGDEPVEDNLAIYLKYAKKSATEVVKKLHKTEKRLQDTKEKLKRAKEEAKKWEKLYKSLKVGATDDDHAQGASVAASPNTGDKLTRKRQKEVPKSQTSAKKHKIMARAREEEDASPTTTPAPKEEAKTVCMHDCYEVGIGYKEEETASYFGSRTMAKRENPIKACHLCKKDFSDIKVSRKHPAYVCLCKKIAVCQACFVPKMKERFGAAGASGQQKRQRVEKRRG